MALQNFVDFLPPSVKAAWLNVVDQLKFTVFEDAVTKDTAVTALLNSLAAKNAAITGLELRPQLISAGIDGGAVNAAVVTLVGPLTTFTRIVGSKVSFLAIATNTGAATLNVNATGAAAILNQQGNALTGGELAVPVIVEWTGAAWKIVAGSIKLGNARTTAETTALVTPVNYIKDPGDLDRYSSVYNLENIGDVIIRDKTEVAQPFSVSGFTDINGELVGSGVITVAPANYTIGFSPGDIAGYYYFRLVGDGKTSFGMQFNGNNQGTYTAYNPAIVNVNFYPTLFSPNSTGQKAIAGNYKDAAGHAIEGSTVENAVIALNTGARQNGVGITSLLTGYIGIGNSFRDGSDSHYFVNSVRGAAFVGNVGVLTNNGGGVDLAGCRETAAVGNSFSDNLAEGIWILRSPSPGGTGQTYRNVLVTGNVMRNNRNYADLDKAEIAIGSHNELGVAQGENAAVIGNLIDVRTSASSTNNFAIWNHPLANRTFVVGNVTVGNTDMVNAPTALDEGAARSHYCFNVGCPEDAAGVSVRSALLYQAAPAGRAVYAYNVNWRIHPSSVGIPTEMESGDAFWQYHLVKPLPQAGIRLMRVLYQGGFTHDLIEVTAISRNDSGICKRTFVVRGAAATPSVVLDNNLDKNFGAFPPTITISAAVNGEVTISSAGNVGVPNNQSTGFFIRITSAEDYPERFIPIFAV